LIDQSGAERARGIASTVGNTMQWWMSVGSFSWDYLAHYCFTQPLSRRVELSQAMGNFGDLSAIMEEVSKLRTDSERLKWIASNYSRALAVAKQLLQHLLSVFDQSVSTWNNFFTYSPCSVVIFCFPFFCLPLLMWESAP
jgi:hypothetical protein